MKHAARSRPDLETFEPAHYVSRGEEERLALEQLTSHGLLVLEGPRKMGKSWLTRALARADYREKELGERPREVTRLPHKNRAPPELRDFLLSAFSSVELRRLVLENPDLEALGYGINWHTSPADVAIQLSDGLSRNNRVAEAFFASLDRERPNRRREIEEAARATGVRKGSVSRDYRVITTSLAHFSERRIEDEERLFFELVGSLSQATRISGPNFGSSGEESLQHFIAEFLLERLTRPYLWVLHDGDRLFETFAGQTLLKQLSMIMRRELLTQQLKIALHLESTRGRYGEPDGWRGSSILRIEPVRLRPFEEEHARRLAKRFALDWEHQQLGEIFSFVGGHPYPLTLAFSELAEPRYSDTGTESWSTMAPYTPYLRHISRWLRLEPSLRESAVSIAAADRPTAFIEPFVQLERLGIIASGPDPDTVEVSSALYKKFILGGAGR